MKKFIVKTSDGHEIEFEYVTNLDLAVIRTKLKAEANGNTRYTKEEVYSIIKTLM